MRFKARKDKNHESIILTARKVGFSVIDTASLGGGVPDLIVSTPSKMFLVEVKDPDKQGLKNEFTPSQLNFIRSWRGVPIQIWRTTNDVLEAWRTS